MRGAARLRLLVALAVAAGSAAALPAAALPARGDPPSPVARSSVDSFNWAGYADVPSAGLVTMVTGRFVVPTLRGSAPPGFSATWVGIGGWSTSDLIQAGTNEDTVASGPTGPHYAAWYELLPASETLLTNCRGAPACPVRPGDHLAVTIREVGPNLWSIAVLDLGRWSWSATVPYLSSGSSAEWIAEATSLVAVPTVYADLSPARFDHGAFVVTGHPAQAIGQGGPQSTAISVEGLATEATPSSLDRDRDGFAVCAYASSCPAPAS